MKIEKGKKYLCIKDVVMDVGNIAYKCGEIYLSEVDNALTDEQEDKTHWWTTDDHPQKYFEKLQTFEWGSEVEVSDNQSYWRKAIFIAPDPNNSRGYIYMFDMGNGVSTLGAARYCRNIQYKEITKQEIADKFEIPLDKLKITD